VKAKVQAGALLWGEVGRWKIAGVCTVCMAEGCSGGWWVGIAVWLRGMESLKALGSGRGQVGVVWEAGGRWVWTCPLWWLAVVA